MLRSLKERCVQKAKEFSAQPWVETRVLSEIATRGIVISVLCEIAITEIYSVKSLFVCGKVIKGTVSIVLCEIATGGILKV